MPNKLYEAANQTAVVVGAVNPGVDIIPGNVLKLALVGLADWTLDATTILVLSNWTTFLATTDKTHAITPFIDGFEIAPTTPITEAGNDNTTANGVPRTRSTSFATGKGKFSGADVAQIKQLKKLAAKSGNFQQGTRLGLIMLHEGKTISCATAGKPIPVYNFFISDPKKGGLGASNDYDFEFHLEGGWGDDEIILEAAFKVATLTNPAGS